MTDTCPDIFISYSSKDYNWVYTLATALNNCGYNVWWDRKLLPGQNFHEHIQNALDTARCVITIWSKTSIKSHWVLGESSQAQERKVLIPVLYQDIRIPTAFQALHNADMQDWDGDIDSTAFRQLLRAINSILKNKQEKGGVSTHTHKLVSNKNRGCSLAISITLSLIPCVST